MICRKNRVNPRSAFDDEKAGEGWMAWRHLAFTVSPPNVDDDLQVQQNGDFNDLNAKEGWDVYKWVWFVSRVRRGLKGE